MHSGKFLFATLAVVAVILHGSLYPYDFELPAGTAGSVETLLQSWATPPSSYGDLVANVLLYVPLGFFGALTIGASRGNRLFIIVLAGLLLSVGIELAQYYDVGRVTNMSDVYLNTSGTMVGAVAGSVLGAISTNHSMADFGAHPIPVMLLLAMLGYHLFPYVPTIDAHKYWQSVRPLVISPEISAQAIYRYTALWLTSSWLIGAILGYRRSLIVLPLFGAAVFLSKILIEGLVITPSEVCGAALAAVLWLVLGSSQRLATLVVTAVLCCSIIMGRLEPFEFGPDARAFSWLPFRGFLDGSISVNTMAFMEKFFLYGSLVWLLRNTGLPLWFASASVSLLLFTTSFAEIYLPDRSAEITDAVMAVMIGFVMAPMANARSASRILTASDKPQNTRLDAGRPAGSRFR